NRSTTELDGAAREIVSATTEIADGAEQVRERTAAVRTTADSVNSVVIRARSIAGDSRSAFSAIRQGAEEIIEMQQEVNTISRWNGRNNHRLAERTAHFTTSDDTDESTYRITQALESHHRWIDNLEDLLDHGSPEAIHQLSGTHPTAQNCELGRWLESLKMETHFQAGGSDYAQSAEALATLRSSHEEFHVRVREALDAATREGRGLSKADVESIMTLFRRMVREIDRLDDVLDTVSS
ncbi:MAG TPA: CZB domain-containing protein, partial [Alkalispirochaeta sp.]|nr:CZB domain-containing protein [Alkalispirochaeta sp.]